MPALNFKARFAVLVESLRKRQTIRARRKDGRDPKCGETLYHYTGMRTKVCRKLLTSVCKSTHPIRITEVGFYTTVTVDGKELCPVDVEMLANADGFESTGEFLKFFKDGHGLPFDGLLIKW